MKLKRAQFLDQPLKAITLLGMSGAGKSYFSEKLSAQGWSNYSCDYLIGTEYLKDYLRGAKMGVDDIGALSEFVGQIGDPARGGLERAEFERRQKMYYDAERQSIIDVSDAVSAAHARGENFIVDSSGSLCEIEDEAALAELGARTLFVYLKISQDDHQDLLERATSYPKPLYFPPAFFDERLAFYKSEFDMSADHDIDPLQFLRWVFPYLFEARLPKYKHLADLYGVTIPVKTFSGAESADDFISVIAEALDE